MSIKIALTGNPNCGKTTLFNALTGSNQFVGNWPGVTVEKKEGSSVPVLVWKITEYDEARLDRYEGYPTFYYKDTMNVEVFSLLGDVSLGRVDAIIYIMHEERKLGLPSLHYYEVCLDGYAHFGFDPSFLENALTDSVGKRYASKLLKEVGLNE
jgi:hypothetical protein